MAPATATLQVSADIMAPATATLQVSAGLTAPDTATLQVSAGLMAPATATLQVTAGLMAPATATLQVSAGLSHERRPVPVLPIYCRSRSRETFLILPLSTFIFLAVTPVILRALPRRYPHPLKIFECRSKLCVR